VRTDRAVRRSVGGGAKGNGRLERHRFVRGAVGSWRRVRAWPEPAWVLWRCWAAWRDQPPPPTLQTLLDWLARGNPLMLYDST
jgi:DNA-binding transcriptional LysR family regulator